MNYLMDKKQRVPSENIYNVFITIILAIFILWIIYIFTPYTHYNLYIIEPKNKKTIS
jgi:hypothetical protein